MFSILPSHNDYLFHYISYRTLTNTKSAVNKPAGQTDGQTDRAKLYIIMDH